MLYTVSKTSLSVWHTLNTQFYGIRILCIQEELHYGEFSSHAKSTNFIKCLWQLNILLKQNLV
jgi:hypothetical protein